MLARCSRCQNTFTIQQFGRQTCPSCGSEVIIADPYAAPSVPHGAMLPPVDDVAGPIPWERRHELGVGKALLETLKLALGEPTRFFASMRYDSDAGAHLFVLYVLIVPMILASLIGLLLRGPKPDLQELLGRYGGAIPPGLDTRPLMDALQHLLDFEYSAGGLVISAISGLVLWFAGIYVAAAVTHLVLMIFSKANGGWTATRKVFLYSFSPGPLMFLPVCGSLLVVTWATVLQILGLAKAHRISVGWSTVGVLGFHFGVTCCTCGVATALSGLAMSALGIGGQ